MSIDQYRIGQVTVLAFAFVNFYEIIINGKE